jgi:hypothetical protein
MSMFVHLLFHVPLKIFFHLHWPKSGNRTRGGCDRATGDAYFDRKQVKVVYYYIKKGKLRIGKSKSSHLSNTCSMVVSLSLVKISRYEADLSYSGVNSKLTIIFSRN